MRNSFITNVYGNQNVVGTGVNVRQEITPAKHGDIQSLLNALRELNLADDDLSKIQSAVNSETIATKDKFRLKGKCLDPAKWQAKQRQVHSSSAQTKPRRRYCKP